MADFLKIWQIIRREIQISITSTPLNTNLSASIISDADSNATSEDDVRNGATTVYLVDVDNSANAATTYVKLYDNAGPTVGTTAPDIILKVTASTRKVFTLDMGGIAFTTGLSFASLTAGGTAGSTGPTSDVIVKILCS